jgi:hypothetical protein
MFLFVKKAREFCYFGWLGYIHGCAPRAVAVDAGVRARVQVRAQVEEVLA